MEPPEQKKVVSTSGKRKIEEKHKHIPGRGLIGNLALGLTDGVITNVAFLAGFAGANQGIAIIRFAGYASMLAGAVSMFFSGLNASRAEHDLFKADANRELLEIEQEPDEEKQELKNIYIEKGLTAKESEIVVRRISSDKQKWLDDLLIHEIHVSREELEHPLKMASVIGLSFLIGALVPLLGYLFSIDRVVSIATSVILSLVFLFFVGGWKGRLVERKFWRAGLEMLLIGVAASSLLFLIGYVLVFV
ncbi:MAG: VIT1/CCC1 transporter family protein [Thaumarchaeota archaeon]|nr:VIT1/CCC1 transporter family protein [Nitrososphaerota archaeon]